MNCIIKRTWWIHSLSVMAVTAPKAQQLPQPPWSRISLMLGHCGHLLLGSNSEGISSKSSSPKRCGSLSGGMNFSCIGRTPSKV